jgi:dTDP-4-amino-4,6-dideoxy-D-galactose acyltransferase
MTDLCTLLAWDSQHWGFPVARINANILTENTARETTRWCGEHKVKCLYFAADATCSETLEQVWRNSFRFVDVRIDLERKVSGMSLLADQITSCRKARPEDLVFMEELARTAHEDARFFKDWMFDRTKAAEMYAMWIRRDMREHEVFVAPADESSDVLGYSSASTVNSQEGRIGLLAVSPAARGRGIGRQLVLYALERLESYGIRNVRVATQGTNVAALRLYEECGFRVADVKVWFHRWFNS